MPIEGIGLDVIQTARDRTLRASDAEQRDRTMRSLSSGAHSREVMERGRSAIRGKAMNADIHPMAIGYNRPLSYTFARNAGGPMMTSDLWALIATIGLAMGQLTIASILTLRQLGGRWVAGARDEPRAASGISGRFVRAHRNLLEIFPQFVAALFVVHAAGVAGYWSAIGAWIFFAARCLYVPAYAFGPIGVRPACWITGQIGIVLILADLIR